MQNQKKTRVVLYGVPLKHHFFSILMFILLSSVFSSSAFCLESAGQILKELDAHYYYPQKQGLKKLSVRIDWEQLDVVTDSGLYLKNPSIEFLWEQSPIGSKSIFRLVDGSSAEASSERKTEMLRTLENYKEVVIPKTLSNKMADHVGQIKTVEKQKRLLEFTSQKAQADNKKIGLMVDLGKKNVRRILTSRKNAPFEVVSDVRYTRKGDKWLIAESRSRFRVGEMKYQETTEYVYRRTGKFWLVGKMSQTLKNDDRTLQSFTFRFRNYKLN